MCIQHVPPRRDLAPQEAPPGKDADTSRKTAPERPEPLPEPDPCEPLSVTA